MTEILVCAFDAVSGPGAPLLVHRKRVPVALARRRELGEAVRAGVHARFGLFPHGLSGEGGLGEDGAKGVSVKKERRALVAAKQLAAVSSP